MKLPIGTKIRFTKYLYEDACGDHPLLEYAFKGQIGSVVGV